MSCPCGHTTPEEHRERSAGHEYRPTCPRDQVWYIYPHRDNAEAAKRVPGAQVLIDGEWVPVNPTDEHPECP